MTDGQFLPYAFMLFTTNYHPICNGLCEKVNGFDKENVFKTPKGEGQIKCILREHPFNLKGGGCGFFSESKYFFRFAAEENFFSRHFVATLFFFYKNNNF